MIPKINSAHGSDTRNIINRAIEVLNHLGIDVQTLVAEGQLTEEQYAELITVINGHLKSGDVSKFDLQNSLREEIESKREKRVPIGLNDADSDLLAAIEGGEGTTFNLESVPRDNSVSPEKTTFVIESKNLFDIDAALSGYSLDDEGNPTEIGTRTLSDFIPVKSNTDYVATHQFNFQVYDENYNTIGGVSARSAGTPYKTTSLARFMRVAPETANVNEFQFEEGDTITPYNKYGHLYIKSIVVRENDLDDGITKKIREAKNIDDGQVTAKKTDFIEVSPNLFDKNTSLSGKSLDVDGSLRDITNRTTSDFIPVEGNATYVSSHYDTLFQAYDENYNTVGSRTTINPGGRVTTTNTRYVRVAMLTSVVDEYQLEKGDTPSDYMPYGIMRIPNLDVTGVNYEELEQSVQSILSRLSYLEGNIKKVPGNLLNFEELTHTTIHRLATSYDGNLYGFRRDGNTTFFRSSDSGETFEEGFSYNDVSEGGSTTAEGTFVFSDGSISIITRNGKFYHSNSFDESPNLVFEVDEELRTLTTNSFEGNGKKLVFAGGYDHTNTLKNMYYSIDGGQSFDLLKAGDTLNGDGNNHWHSVAYDPYDDTVWLSQGDGANSRVYFTPDWGTNWHYIASIHPTAIYAFPNKVIFGRDKSGLLPGISEWTKSDGIPTDLTDSLTFRDDKGSFDFYPERTNWTSTDPNEYYLLFPPHAPDEENAYIFGTGDGGLTWHLLNNGSDAISQLTGIDKNGYIFATSGKGSESRIFRSKSTNWK